MSTETERITLEVLNRHHLGNLKEGLGSASFQEPESYHPNSNDAHFPHRASIATEEAVRERLD
jgi:hypothetical protein